MACRCVAAAIALWIILPRTAGGAAPSEPLALTTLRQMIEADLVREAKKLAEECKREIPARFTDGTLSAEILGRWSAEEARKIMYPRLLRILSRVCVEESGREIVQAVKAIELRRGTTPSVELVDGRLIETFVAGDFSTANESKRDELIEVSLAERIRWPGKGTLTEHVTLAMTKVCTDGKGHFVGLRFPRRPSFLGRDTFLFYGDARALYRMPKMPQSPEIGAFFEPRNMDTYDPNRSGKAHLWPESYFTPEECRLKCGVRSLALKPLSATETKALLAKSNLQPRPPQYRAHALARNKRGVYFYVDRLEGERSKDFRVFSGKKGNMRQLELMSLVSDSEGDVFETKDGSLRLVLDRQESLWIKNERQEKLIVVPIEDNLKVIYDDLGVYDGKPLGTPCDIF